MKADDLWEKYARNGLTEIGKVDFLDALTEYGELVKAEAVKVCERFDSRSWDEPRFNMANEMASAIEKMEIK